jgi:hypothetical protein
MAGMGGNVPQTEYGIVVSKTLWRAIRAIAVCSGVIGALGLVTTISGWRANPQLGPHGVLQTIGALAAVYGIWFFDTFLLLSLFGGVPWFLLHIAGARRMWIAPLAGFVVAFGLGFWITTAPARSHPEQQSSMWIDNQATMIDGKLTPYGDQIYGPLAGLRNGVVCGLVGAAVGFALWRMTYRNKG